MPSQGDGCFCLCVGLRFHDRGFRNTGFDRVGVGRRGIGFGGSRIGFVVLLVGRNSRRLFAGRHRRAIPRRLLFFRAIAVTASASTTARTLVVVVGGGGGFGEFLSHAAHRFWAKHAAGGLRIAVAEVACAGIARDGRQRDHAAQGGDPRGDRRRARRPALVVVGPFLDAQVQLALHRVAQREREPAVLVELARLLHLGGRVDVHDAEQRLKR